MATCFLEESPKHGLVCEMRIPAMQVGRMFDKQQHLLCRGPFHSKIGPLLEERVDPNSRPQQHLDPGDVNKRSIRRRSSYAKCSVPIPREHLRIRWMIGVRHGKLNSIG